MVGRMNRHPLIIGLPGVPLAIDIDSRWIPPSGNKIYEERGSNASPHSYLSFLMIFYISFFQGCS
jgi:hypothetical protein